MKKRFKTFLWGNIPYAYHSIFNSKSDKLKYYKYFTKHGYTHFPFDFAKEYTNMRVDIKFDESKDLPYVIHRGTKKLYFPKIYAQDKITKLYQSLLFEQDVRSPHHYIQTLEELKGKTLLDIGSAEGIFSLDAIETIHFAYMFECDPQWIKALEATFEPWKEKIQIVAKFISNEISDNTLTIDSFLKDKPSKNLFLKMDIEGEERFALQGAEKLFTESPDLEFAICIYHRKDDKSVISAFLDKYDCKYAINKELLYYKHDFRPCLIRGNK